MTAHSARRRISAAGAALVAGALLLTACGDDGDSKPPVDKSAPLYAKVPEKYQKAQVIKVGSDVAYPPNEYYDKDGKTIIGLDPDIGNAVSKQLGIKLKFQNGKFDDLIVSMQSNRIDIIMSSMSDTKKRQEGTDDTGKKAGPGVDFVDYFNAGTSILVQKGNPKGIKTLDDLCGQTIALQKGTTQEDMAKAQQDKCAAAGKGKIEVLTFDKDTEAQLQVRQGRAVADLNDFPVAIYNAETANNGNDFEVVGDQIEAGPYGIALRKEDQQLRDVIKEAVDNIIKSGEYKQILDARKLSAGAVTQAAVNGGS
ncbi:ABC transporter substrate-binding protein [Uniformispora flossi]|uniref:ABC transporter substrate-binding protein n=1 Tax=Uniformispora flossi TaxID=3390723 RepID=UPI003C2F640B